MCLLACGLGLVAAVVSQILLMLIQLCTNIAFFGRFSTENASPADNHLGSVRARRADRWRIDRRPHGALRIEGDPRPRHSRSDGAGADNQSRIPARVAWLKPLSAAISIGTGGPFGAEGPIIATGGALGSLVGQLASTSAAERKTLLAAGAAAGMSATFGSPVSAVLLACELLLFEWRRALADSGRPGQRRRRGGCGSESRGADPVFRDAGVVRPDQLGCSRGLRPAGARRRRRCRVLVTRAVYAVEDAFERLPIHLDVVARARGRRGRRRSAISPRTRSASATTISRTCSRATSPCRLPPISASLKFLSWCDLARQRNVGRDARAALLTIGGGLGRRLRASRRSGSLPAVGVDLRMAALVGMAAHVCRRVAGVLMASVVFGFETTQQPLALLPLLAGCARGVFGVVLPDAAFDHDRKNRAPRRPHAARIHGRPVRTRSWSATSLHAIQ